VDRAKPNLPMSWKAASSFPYKVNQPAQSCLTPVGERVQLTVTREGVVHNLSVELAPTGETTGTISRGHLQPRAARQP
jgi:hypothetical protein